MRAAREYDIGDRVIMTAEFRSAGVLVDPLTVTCSVQPPDGDALSVPVEQLSLGVYSAAIDPTLHGTWWYRFTATGAYTGAEEQSFRIRQRRVGNVV
jgi:hypothetical protein